MEKQQQLPEYRKQYLTLFTNIFQQYVTNNKLDIDNTIISQIARRCERSCYNYVIQECNVNYIDTSIANTKFLHRYSSACSKYLTNLDSQSLVCNNEFISRIINEEVDPKSLATYSSEDMFPEISAEERNKINTRLQQIIDKKYAQNTICRKCKQKTISYYGVQTRATDEGSSLRFECDNCGFSWLE